MWANFSIMAKWQNISANGPFLDIGKSIENKKESPTQCS